MSLLYVFQVIDTVNLVPFSQMFFGITSPKATAPGVLHHWAFRGRRRDRTLWWLHWRPWLRPGPSSWMSRWINSISTQVKSQVSTRAQRGCAGSSGHRPSLFWIPPFHAMARCGGRALRPSLPKLLSPSPTTVKVLLTRKASARAWASKNWEDFAVSSFGSALSTQVTWTQTTAWRRNVTKSRIYTGF